MEQLINKIFRSGRLKFPSKSSQCSDDGFQPQIGHRFDKENIQFIIFRDHDLKGQTVLFDSSQSQTSKSSSDYKKLADMMFGTLPLSRKTTTFKVHAIRSPPQLMITKVFIPQSRNRESSNDPVSFDLYSIESLSSDDHVTVQTEAQDIRTYQRVIQPDVAHSMPLDVPLRYLHLTQSHADDLDLSLTASGNHSIGAPSPGGATMYLSSSYSSRDRRKKRHRDKMIEHLLTSSISDEKHDRVPLHKRPTKIGIAVIFMLPEENSAANRSFQSFFFSHIMLIENYVHQLKGAIDMALAKRSKELIDEAIHVFLGAMSSLYTAPRLKDPAWLSMMTYTTHRMSLSARFLKDFMMLVDKCHTKNTKFFLGVLITAVLTHHLSWAPTVAPVEESPSQTYLDKHTPKWVNSLGRSHPYNPLWAQLGDLYGAIGVPVCLARTVVVGRKQELVSTILFILSYFIRCSEILENVESFPDFADDTDNHFADADSLFADADNHSVSDSETSSVTHDDDLTLKSPVPDCKENVNGRHFQTKDFDGLQCCANPSDCGASLETVALRQSLSLFVKPPPEICAMNRTPLSDSKTSDSDNVDTPTSPSSPNSNADRSANASPTKKQKSVRLECRMKDDDVRENPKVEIERTLGRASADPSPSKKMLLHRVPLSGGLFSESITDYLPAKHDQSMKKNSELKHLNQKMALLRGTSMFDEYFEEEASIPVPCFDLPLESAFHDEKESAFYKEKERAFHDEKESAFHDEKESAFYGEKESAFYGEKESAFYDEKESAFYGEKLHDIYDVETLDDIVNVPCPDVSHFLVDRLTKRNGTFDTGIGCDFEDSTELDNEHFGEMDIESVVNLPDGPSKQFLQKAVSMLHNEFTRSSVDAERMALSGESVQEPRPERCNGHHNTKSKRNRHGSGQSVTVTTNRCRSVTLSESSHSKCNMADYSPVAMPSSCELLKADGCIYLSDECNFGRSLLGDYCSSYTSHFVLHGTSDRQILKAPYTLLHQDLKTSVQNSVLDEPVAESTCIVADTDNWSVQLFSCKSQSPEEPLKPLPLASSLLVVNLIESVYELGKLKMSPEFCLLHLEDQLQSIYLKSQRLADYIKVCRRVYSQELATLLSLDISDMPLLLAVARIHSPQLFRNL